MKRNRGRHSNPDVSSLLAPYRQLQPDPCLLLVKGQSEQIACDTTVTMALQACLPSIYCILSYNFPKRSSMFLQHARLAIQRPTAIVTCAKSPAPESSGSERARWMHDGGRRAVLAGDTLVWKSTECSTPNTTTCRPSERTKVTSSSNSHQRSLGRRHHETSAPPVEPVRRPARGQSPMQGRGPSCVQAADTCTVAALGRRTGAPRRHHSMTASSRNVFGFVMLYFLRTCPLDICCKPANRPDIQTDRHNAHKTFRLCRQCRQLQWTYHRQSAD